MAVKIALAPGRSSARRSASISAGSGRSRSTYRRRISINERRTKGTLSGALSPRKRGPTAAFVSFKQDEKAIKRNKRGKRGKRGKRDKPKKRSSTSRIDSGHSGAAALIPALRDAPFSCL